MAFSFFLRAPARRIFSLLAGLWLAAIVQPLAAQTTSATGGWSRNAVSPAQAIAQTTLSLSAVLTQNDTQPVKSGLKWRIFAEAAQPDGTHKLVAESDQAAPVLPFSDGAYIIHVAYGLAGASRRVAINGLSASERLVLNAGCLKIIALLGDTSIPPQRLNISLFVPDRGNSEAKLVLSKGKPGDIFCLPEGAYHVVSTLLDITSSAPGKQKM